MFSSYLIPLSSVDEEDTLAIGAVVGIAVAALFTLIVLVAIVAVAVFARWWKQKDSGTFDLTTDVSMECSIQTLYCILQEFVSTWNKMLSKIL